MWEIWEEEMVVLRSRLWPHDCESDPEWFTKVARRESGETGGLCPGLTCDGVQGSVVRK